MILPGEADAWAGAREHFASVVLPRLKEVGERSGKAAVAGNEAARLVIEKYTLLQRSFDPLTLILLEEALTKYEAQVLLKREDAS